MAKNEVITMRSSIYRFFSICLELADLVDENGGAGHEVYNKQLGIGYRVLSSYLRKGVQEVIDLQAKYYGAIASKNLAETGEKEAHDFLEDVFGDREPYTINDEDKKRIKAFVKNIMDEWDTECVDE